MLKTTIAKKAVVALTGVIMVGWLVAHLLGNLQIFGPTNAINDYAHKLQELPGLLWGARVFMGIVLLAHVGLTISLVRENRKARPRGYEVERTVRASLASRIMALSGIVVFAFLVFHILHFTTASIRPEYADWVDERGYHDVRRMMIDAFRNPLIVGVYIIGQVLLFSHLGHGMSSFFKSLGLNSPAYQPWIEKFGPAVAWVMCLGFSAIPILIFMGYPTHEMDAAGLTQR